MAYYINKVTLVGSVGRNPDIHTTKNGKKWASLAIATNKYWKDSDGNKQNKSEWHNIVIWNDGLVNNIIEPYVKKGMKVHIEGELETTKYTGKDGIERYQTKVVLQGYDGKLNIVQSIKREYEEEDTAIESNEPTSCIYDDIPF